MKYIKTFELAATEEELSRVGNYVIINPFFQITIKEKKFFNNTIGQIIRIEENIFSPENFIVVQYNKKDIPLYVILNKDLTYFVKSYEIILEYKNKEDLESFLISKKYNL
jgi:hypothetical protein